MSSDDTRNANERNRRIYETGYTARNYAPRADDDVFGRLATTKLDLLRSATRPGDRVLDLCCGSGEALRPLALTGVAVTGVDFSAPILDELRGLFAAQGGDAATLDLRRADARAIPSPDASFDVVACFSALYTIPEPERVLAEIARVLKPGGRAVLDCGIRRSLNALEARRVETGVSSFELRPGPLLRRLADLGLAAVEDRAFQLFPCWGGATPRAKQVLNPLLAKRLAERLPDGRTLDEAVASAPLHRPFSFRRLLVLERTTPAAARELLAVRRAAERAAALDALASYGATPAGPRAALRRIAAEKRASAAVAAERGFVAEAATLYVAALAADPLDLDAVLGLADLFDGPEERASVARWRKLAARSRAQAVATATPRTAPAAPVAPVAHAAPNDVASSAATASPTPVDRTSPRPSGAPTGSVAARAPKISVVLPVYNDAARLPHAVASVLGQIFRDFELIVVDDGSTDGSAATLNAIRDPRLRVVRQENRKLPGALNAGFALARGEYFTWTSSDNLCAPAMLAELAATLDAAPEAGMAVGGFAWIDDEDRLLRVTRGQDVSPAAFFTRNPGNAAFLYRASLAREVGDYDPALEGAEDWDYWIRLAERAPVVRTDAILYYYREHAASMTATIPEKVAAASRATFLRAVARADGELDLDRLYPALARCADRAAAENDAAFDLGVRMLKSPWCPPEFAARCFATVLERAPGAGMAAANLALALGRAGKLEEAAAWAARLDGAAHPHAKLIAARVATAARSGSPGVLAHTPPFQLDATSGELMRALAAASATPARAAESPPAPTTPAARTAAAAEPPRAASDVAADRAASPEAAGAATSPSLSFVIITAGARPRALAATVRSIRAQRAPGAEILVVGAGGAPEGARFIPAEDDARAGRLGAMRNQGFAAARGTHAVVLDDDMLLAPDWYARFREAYAAEPHFSVLTSQVRVPDGGRYWDYATHGGPLGHRILEAHEQDDFVYATGGGGYVVARETFLAVPYDAGRGFYEGEDLDFARRLRDAGRRIRHAHACVVWHADPTYSTVGRRVVRRQAGRDASTVASAYLDATPDMMLADAAEAEKGGLVAEAADLLRFGIERFPEDRRFARAFGAMEKKFGGRLSDVRYRREGDPEFLALARACGHPAAAAEIAAAAG